MRQGDQQVDVGDLVRADTVHRDLYCSPVVYAHEQNTVFRKAWLFAAHESQLPNPGDWISLDLAGQPILIVRQADSSIKAMENRCAHKGSPIMSGASGKIRGQLRCAYHGWTYEPDGKLAVMPLKQAYENTGLKDSTNGRGLVPFEHLVNYRGFIFIRLSNKGPDFKAWFGHALEALDNMVERSPSGVLKVAGAPLRHRIKCNWKIYLENINDAIHPVTAHRSAAIVAAQHWREQPDDASKPMVIEQMLPFGASYDFFDAMGATLLPNGHSFFGTQQNIHSSYRQLDDYGAAMIAAWGEDKAQQILAFQSQNTVLWPSASVKSSPLAIRVLRPVSVNETILESWAFSAQDAPATLTERALTYNRVAFSPMSVIAHDDVHLFESIQRQLAADGNPWISLHRNAPRGDTQAEQALATEGHSEQSVNSTSEALMRNQFKAWAHLAQPD
ncbi:MAG: Rieske 2Fe-2S domain-containing protein [Burkholderiaceae bacterium]